MVNHHLKVPFHLLRDVPDLACGEPGEGNLIVEGDNLVALKALLPYYAGQVKCIYIDPPYNTGNEGWAYNDNVNNPVIKEWLGQVVGKEGETLDRHERWLCMIYPRLALLKQFLRNDGVIFASIDDNEVANLKHIMDEIFGAQNFINQVSVKMKQTAGASGGGEDKRLKKNIEFVLVYARDKDGEGGFKAFNELFDEEDLFGVIQDMRDSGKSWKYTRVLKSFGDKVPLKTILDGSGEEIDIFRHDNVEMVPITHLCREEGLTEQECYKKYFDLIFRDTNAQSSIRTRVMEATSGQGDFFSIEYVPRSGRNKGKKTTLYYKGANCDLIAWLKDVAVKRGEKLVKLEKTGTYWDGFPLNNLTKEGDVQFPNGKKPEALVQRILDLSTSEGDLVLDSFAGSGTTGAVAQKMKRNWILVEEGTHANTHIVPRLSRVVNGQDSAGITTAVNWRGGGGFRFCKLDEQLFNPEGTIRDCVNFSSLARHVYFTETGEPLPRERVPNTPLLGVCRGVAIYLLYNGILGDKSVNGGNVLTRKTLALLPPFDGPKVVFAAGCLLGRDRLAEEQITVRQTPYEIRVS